MLFVFFVKQKTAYEMRISDWSSDVCSSDLSHRAKSRCPSGAHYLTVSRLRSTRTEIDMADVHPVIIVGGGPAGMVAGLQLARAGVPVTKIGRASCRERVCQYV